MRKPRLILTLTLLALLALAVVWLILAPAPTVSATATFSGYLTNSASLRVPAFTITNTGNTTLRRWDFYNLDDRPAGTSSEIHLGPDAYLSPGQSEVVTLPAPVTASAWRITLYFSPDGWRRKVNDATDRWPILDRLLPERFRGLSVDHQVRSDWISE